MPASARRYVFFSVSFVAASAWGMCCRAACNPDDVLRHSNAVNVNGPLVVQDPGVAEGGNLQENSRLSQLP